MTIKQIKIVSVKTLFLIIIIIIIMVVYKPLFPAISPPPLARPATPQARRTQKEETVKGKRIFKALSGSKSFYFCNMFWLINSRKRWKERKKMSGST